jgi:hypothetical protein
MFLLVISFKRIVGSIYLFLRLFGYHRQVSDLFFVKALLVISSILYLSLVKALLVISIFLDLSLQKALLVASSI